jgi:hypothetical protein
MFSTVFKSSGFIISIFSRSYSSKPPSQYRPISPQLRFHIDTKSVYGPQHVIREKRSTKPSEFDLFHTNPNKKLFENDTELLYGTSTGLRRVCSIPKGISITERQRYLRHLFRIPRGQRASLYPQAYVPTKYFGLRRNKLK